MRWQVHGTDTLSGQDVVLGLNDQEAVQAVQTAMDRHILVSHITRTQSARRFAFPTVCAAILILLPLCIAVYYQNILIRSHLAQAVEEQSRLAQSVAKAEQLVAEFRRAAPAQVLSQQEAAARINALSDQLASIRGRLGATEQQLSTERQQVEVLRHYADDVPALRQRLTATVDSIAAKETQVAQLTEQSLRQQRQVTELIAQNEHAAPRFHQLEKENADLSAQVDLLKQQLLIAAAKSTAPTPSDPEEEPVTASPSAPASRWALGTDYDAARNLILLHFARETLATTNSSTGDALMTATNIANAATIRILHDRSHEHLYSAMLTVSLAPDAPQDKLSENLALVTEFLKTFAPALKNPDAIAAGAAGQLAQKSTAERQVLLTEDFKLTTWNNRQPGQPNASLFSFKVESSRKDLDE